MFKGLGNLTSLLKNAGQMRERMEGLNERLKSKRVQGSAGGGLVSIEANGLQEVLSCRIDPKLFEQGDAELIEDLVAGAVNQAMAKARELHAEAMQDLTGGMDLPGMQDMLGKFGGTGGPDSAAT
ncbi:MAG: YbaB/EbfC family nucleoid-associated protein [Planctomycetales bacterium]